MKFAGFMFMLMTDGWTNVLPVIEALSNLKKQLNVKQLKYRFICIRFCYYHDVSLLDQIARTSSRIGYFVYFREGLFVFTKEIEVAPKQARGLVKNSSTSFEGKFYEDFIDGYGAEVRLAHVKGTISQ